MGEFQMKRFLKAFAATILAGSTFCSIATAAEKMTGREITALLSGNSMTGVTSKGVEWTEFYAPGGAIRGISKGERHSGNWSTDGDRVCFDYPAWEYRVCATVSPAAGSKYLFHDDKGKINEYTVLKSNPSDL